MHIPAGTIPTGREEYAMPPAITSQKVDILVLGAGLAGLRAAWAALEQAPCSRVMVVRPGRGPSGSSFSNVNNMLGMQVCMDTADEDALVADVQASANQGHVDASLVRIMAGGKPETV